MRLPAIHVLTDSMKWTGKIFSINWGKAYSNLLFLGTFKAWCVSYDQEDYCCSRTGIRPMKNNQWSGLCLWLWHASCSSLLCFTRVLFRAFFGFEPIFICHCWIVRSKRSILIESVEWEGEIYMYIYFKSLTKNKCLKQPEGKCRSIAHAHECIHTVTPHMVIFMIIIRNQKKPHPWTHIVKEH